MVSIHSYTKQLGQLAVIKNSYKDRLCIRNRIKQCSSISNASRRKKELGDKGMRQGGLLAWLLCGKGGVVRRLAVGDVVVVGSSSVGGHQV